MGCIQDLGRMPDGPQRASKSPVLRQKWGQKCFRLADLPSKSGPTALSKNHPRILDAPDLCCTSHRLDRSTQRNL